jgi:hypothetical protein
MAEANRINLGMGVFGEDDRPAFFDRPLTLDRVISWIKKKEDIEEPVRAELIKFASKYPNSALSAFVKNFDSYLGKARHNAAQR